MRCRGSGFPLGPGGGAACVVVLAAALTAGCSGGTAVSVSDSVTAAPMCPLATGATVVPACIPQPLSGVHLTIVTATGGSQSGTVVAEPVTDQTGSFVVALQPGEYRVQGQGMPALVAPSPVFFDVAADSRPVEITLRYDADIR